MYWKYEKENSCCFGRGGFGFFIFFYFYFFFLPQRLCTSQFHSFPIQKIIFFKSENFLLLAEYDLHVLLGGWVFFLPYVYELLRVSWWEIWCSICLLWLYITNKHDHMMQDMSTHVPVELSRQVSSRTSLILMYEVEWSDMWPH